MKVYDLFIDNSASLDDYIKQASGCTYVALDTEFISGRTYYPTLCLIQICYKKASKKYAAIVDVLNSDIDLTSFFAMINDKKVMKVMHAAHQDIEIFYQLTGKIPQPIFDTQIAAMACDLESSISYHKIVKNITHKCLEKESQRSDWGKRPLSQKQIQYALNDVIYLCDVYDYLDQYLRENERIAWIKEDHDQLIDENTYKFAPEMAWKKISTNDASPAFVARLRETAAWRDEQAKKHNCPRSHIIKDKPLIGIAKRKIKKPEDIGFADLTPFLKKNRWEIEKLFTKVNRVETIDREQWQPPKPTGRKNGQENEKYVLELLTLCLKIRAQELKVARSLIAKNQDLIEFIRGGSQDNSLRQGWRYQVFGKMAEQILAGEISVACHDNTINFVK